MTRALVLLAVASGALLGCPSRTVLDQRAARRWCDVPRRTSVLAFSPHVPREGREGWSLEGTFELTEDFQPAAHGYVALPQPELRALVSRSFPDLESLFDQPGWVRCMTRGIDLLRGETGAHCNPAAERLDDVALCVIPQGEARLHARLFTTYVDWDAE